MALWHWGPTIQNDDPMHDSDNPTEFQELSRRNPPVRTSEEVRGTREDEILRIVSASRTGDRQAQRQPCMLTRAQNSLLATWKSGPRQLTIVGARDLEEVGDLMAHFEASESET